MFNKIIKNNYIFKVFEGSTVEFIKIINNLNKKSSKKEQIEYTIQQLPYEDNELFTYELITLNSDEETMEGIIEEYVKFKGNDIQYLGMEAA